MNPRVLSTMMIVVLLVTMATGQESGSKVGSLTSVGPIQSESVQRPHGDSHMGQGQLVTSPEVKASGPMVVDTRIRTHTSTGQNPPQPVESQSVAIQQQVNGEVGSNKVDEDTDAGGQYLNKYGYSGPELRNKPCFFCHHAD